MKNERKTKMKKIGRNKINEILIYSGLSDRIILSVLKKLPRGKKAYSVDSINQALSRVGIPPNRIPEILSEFNKI